MQNGSVKFYNATKGYGFISQKNGGPDIFVHASDLARSGIDDLSVGEEVSFETKQTPKGQQAINVRVLN